MGVVSTTRPVADLPRPFEPRDAATASREDSNDASVWIARAAIVGVALGFIWYTWGHWGDFQIDNGRELYIPAEILKGKLLFRDLWYMYGPLAAYVNAFLFWIFGVRLTVLYVFGCFLTIGTALITFEISRQFKLGLVGSLAPPLCFLVEAFYPFIRNFVFPYSYAATLGAFLGSICLYFVIRHASGMRRSHLAAAAVLSSLVILTKQEFGAACLAILCFEIAACYLIRRSVPELLRDTVVLIAGHLPAVAGYGWLVWKISARSIFFDNWISTPGTYFMRTWSKITLPQQGLRFIPSELLETAEFTALGLALWALAACLVVAAIKKLNLKSRSSVGLSAFVALAPLWVAAVAFAHRYPYGYAINPTRLASFVTIPFSQASFPKGIFFLVVLFTLYAIWKFLSSPANGSVYLQESALGIYAGLVAVRQMMELRPQIYLCAVFFNIPAFLVFIILLRKLIRWACGSLDSKQGDFVAGSLLAGEICMLFILFFPKPQSLSTPLVTDYGSFYTRADVATLFPQIISFMKSHTQNGKDILVLPEPPSLYVFAGLDAPSRMYSLLPGYVAPDQEQAYIDELASNHVRYVLIANRNVVEYGVLGFANGGYNKPIHDWIMSNYVRVSQFGPVPEAPFPAYIMWVYERKDLLPASSN